MFRPLLMFHLWLVRSSGSEDRAWFKPGLARFRLYVARCIFNIRVKKNISLVCLDLKHTRTQIPINLLAPLPHTVAYKVGISSSTVPLIKEGPLVVMYDTSSSNSRQPCQVPLVNSLSYTTRKKKKNTAPSWITGSIHISFISSLDGGQKRRQGTPSYTPCRCTSR